MSYFKGCRETGTYCTQSGGANSILGLSDTECNLQILWLDSWSKHPPRWRKRSFMSSSNICSKACSADPWIFCLKTTLNRYFPPRCFLYGSTALLRLNWYLCRPKSSRDGRNKVSKDQYVKEKKSLNYRIIKFFNTNSCFGVLK
jgi:hypothetical protein